MNKRESLHIPRFDWLVGGSRIGGTYNRYFGSTGTDPLLGIFNQQIFNYTVWIEKEDEKEVLKCAWWEGTDCLKSVSQEKITEKSFEAKEENLKAVEKFLNTEMENFFQNK